MRNDISIIEREKINDKKWNGCIHFGFNGLPYAYSWYLDIVAENWKGIVYKDYEAVFPVVWNRKLGIDYMFKPFYTQQLGLFSLDPLPTSLVKKFYNIILNEFRYIDIQVNPKNWIENTEFQLKERPNYILNLNRSYEDIASEYSGGVKRNLKRADKFGIKISNQVKPEKFIELYEEHTAPKIKEYSKRNSYMLLRLIYHSSQYNVGFVTGVLNKSGELVAAGFFIYNQKFIINLISGTNDEGKSTGAMTAIVDYLIRVNENKPRNLDFEGSSIESIAKFYKGFGAREMTYYHIKSNKLPWFLKLLKN